MNGITSEWGQDVCGEAGCGVYCGSSHGTGLLRCAMVLPVVRGHVARTGVRRMSRDRQWECEP